MQSISAESAHAHHKGHKAAEGPAFADAYARAAGEGGGEAAPRLESSTLEKRYVPLELPFRESPLSNWVRINSDDYQADDSGQFVFKYQQLAVGSEISCKKINLPDMDRMLNSPRPTGKREKADESAVVADSSLFRSKSKVRHLCKQLGVDRLMTLTKRESSIESSSTLEDWKPQFKKFIRLARKAGVDLQYVAVPERHKKGNYHLHVAVKGFKNIKILRSIWWSVCGGRGMGNIDITPPKLHLPTAQQTCGIAKYISKYISKQKGQVEFNKRRYWSSDGVHIPKPIHHITSAVRLEDALKEVCARFNLSEAHVRGMVPGVKGWFFFADGSGFWGELDSSYYLPPPF